MHKSARRLAALLAPLVILVCTPSATAAPAASVSGPEQMVYDYSRSACGYDHIPDLPVRALREAGGNVSLSMSHWTNRRLSGGLLSSLLSSCDVTASSLEDPDPAAWADRQWIASPYTTDGKHAVALVHDEYQGSTHPGQCPSGSYEKCWYNALTLATSENGGRTWSAPRHRAVATLPYRYQPDAGTRGYAQPSNIVRSPTDGYYYATFLAFASGAQARGTCVIRTQNLDDPKSWRAWNGRSFSIAFMDPYRQSDDPAKHVCKPLDYSAVGEMTQSLTYSTYFGKFMLVGESKVYDRRAGKHVTGVYFSLSTDMVRWTTRQLVLSTEFPWSHTCSAGDPLSYPSVVDPASTSRSFETVGRTAQLYLTRFHYSSCTMTWDRDLVRFPIAFAR